MIQRLMGHLRGNAVAYVALFVALGGTSYAATSLPRDSVGTKQLRNGAVTPAKLSKAVGAQVAAVTEINASGTVLPSVSIPKKVTTEGWQASPTSERGIVSYPHRFARTCTAVASVLSPAGGVPSPPSVSAAPLTLAGFSKVQVAASSVTGLAVVILCPRDA